MGGCVGGGGVGGSILSTWAIVLAQVADVIVVLVLVVDVVVEAVDKQEMAVKVNNICIITVDLIL